LWWAVIGTVVHGAFCVTEAILDHFLILSRVLSIASALISLVIAANCGGFVGSQIIRARKNQTTLEEIGREELRYDLGAANNLNQFFGSLIGMLWPVPNDLLSGFEWCLPEYQNARLATEPDRTP
jgi:hypothetical protein